MAEATKPKRARYDSQKRQDKNRGKARVYIGDAFERWRQLKAENNLKTDADLATLLIDGYEKRSSISVTSTGTCMQQPTESLGRVSPSERGKRLHVEDVGYQSETTRVVSELDRLQNSFEEIEVTIDDECCSEEKNRLSNSDSAVDKDVETTELSYPGAGDIGDEGVYVPIIPQRSTKSELLLECEEEELEPWQKPTLHVHVKEEDDTGELNDNQTDCKPDSSTLLSWSAGQYAQKQEDDGVVHTRICNNSVSLSGVQSPEVYATSSKELRPEKLLNLNLDQPAQLKNNES